jgi:nucleoporin NUP1
MPAQDSVGQKRSMVARSNSFIGTIKNILPVKLPWFGSSRDQSDTPSKRKETDERQDVEDSGRSNKRQRIEETLEDGKRASGGQPRLPSSATGYLDPPQRAFGHLNPARPPRMPPIHARSSSVAYPPRSKSRITMSPGLGGARSQTMRIARTQSMDPPSRFRSTSYKPALTPLALSRDASMEDLSFQESPSSPSRPFKMRTSMTPQIPDLELGPSTRRDTSEPPPLSDLVTKPVFVRAPPDVVRQVTPLARQSSLTLGDVAEAQKQVIRVILGRVYSRCLYDGRCNRCSDGEVLC